MRSLLWALTCLLILGACSGAPGSRGSAGPPRDSAGSSTNAAPESAHAPGSFRAARLRIRLETVAEGFVAPLGVTNARDGSGRLFVVEQGGRIYQLIGRRMARRPWLDISGLVTAGGEQGLLGLAFDPDFATNGRFFVNYTDTSGDTVVASYRAGDRQRADPASARVVLTIDQPFANHNGGGLAFGRDGYLYVATGDGGSAGDPFGNGQSLDTLLGKILRIDVSGGAAAAPYRVPPSNPFVGRDEARPEIWAYGLRNPWRFGFDRATGELWIGDVGQSEREEIDRGGPGGGRGVNYGWNLMEGTRCFVSDPCEHGGLREPVAEYDHDDGCSVTGGYVYRGRAQPALVGGYFFGDYCSGKIWAIDASERGFQPPVELLDTEVDISSFGEGEDGELYLTDLAGGRVLHLLASR